MTAARGAHPIKVLLVEDNPGDARLITEMLREADATVFDLEQVDRLAPALERLSGLAVDVVLLDLGLPDSVGLETFRRAYRGARSQPIIVISGLDDEEFALQAVRDGAQDYLVKGRIEGRLLARVIHYAIERKQAELSIREREERFRQIADNIREVFFVMEAQFRKTVYINPAYERTWGCTTRTLNPHQAYIAEGRLGRDPGDIEFSIRRPDGAVRRILSHAVPIPDERGEVYRIAGVALDITERQQAENALRRNERRLRTLFETVNLVVLGLDARGRVDYVNPYFTTLTGYTVQEVIGVEWAERFVPEALRASLREAFQNLVGQELHPHYENPILTKAGKERMISWHNTVVRDAEGRPTGTLSIGEDVTERATMERQLRQAQKMEAVGNLAGGVAHDFNNLL
ncbi:MAG TPA: PAS domain S-box protein, partial [Gemmatimonadales bacterium]|nr:PAS domain S-box protein [Gemmatimonadales bacterium]